MGDRAAVCPHLLRQHFRPVCESLMRSNGTPDTWLETIGNGIQVKLSMAMTEEPVSTSRVAAFAGAVRVPTVPAGDLEIDLDGMPKLMRQCQYPMALSLITLTCAFV